MWWDASATAKNGENRETSWGYGPRPSDIEEVYHRIETLTAALVDHPGIAGFCYTQLTDVEQEQNGIYTYDRRQKFDRERLKKVFGRERPPAKEDMRSSPNPDNSMFTERYEALENKMFDAMSGIL